MPSSIVHDQCHHLASFPDSTPKLFIAPCNKKLGGGVWERHGAIKSLGVESGNEAIIISVAGTLTTWLDTRLDITCLQVMAR